MSEGDLREGLLQQRAEGDGSRDTSHHVPKLFFFALTEE
jgi:hypothetical protein